MPLTTTGRNTFSLERKVDGFGNTIPNMVAQPGRYANVRWMSASVFGLSGITGATMKLLTAPFYRVFF
jgi:hypothetical protein